MEKIAHTALIAILVFLVVIALNISNRSINLLTGENRGPVVGVTVNGENIGVQWLGENYNCDRQTLEDSLDYVKAESRVLWQQAGRCLGKVQEFWRDICPEIW